MQKKRVLIGSPIYQKPKILSKFLTSLQQLNRPTISIDYMFVNDNIDKRSSNLLHSFSPKYSSVDIIAGNEIGQYTCDDETHYWNDQLMLKVANYKNKIIDFALQEDYDYLFLVDSDLVLHPNLIEYLISLNKEIISEIFWSSWHTGAPKLPNAWLFDEYSFAPKNTDEKSENIANIKFLNMLKIPGLYPVGGLGACTLISSSALRKGVNFKPIRNLTIHGEDRFFCIRAAVLDIDLFIDTHYPAYHIYREADLSGVSDFIKDCAADDTFKRTYRTDNNTITLSMIVKNEENRYLKQVLQSLCKHIDNAVIIDDGSTDNTIQICKDILKDIPLRIVQNKKTMFQNEVDLRQLQWNETIKTNPDWILNLDSDEILEESFWKEKQTLIDNPLYDIYAFRLYDMWNDTSYREDHYWNAHKSYRPFLIRYQPDFQYKFNEIPQHCGRFPINIFSHPFQNSDFKIKHFGWSTEKDRLEKKERYRVLDPNAIYGVKEQYDSIMDKEPILKEFYI